jgi:DNA-binding response OmpR family regulator
MIQSNIVNNEIATPKPQQIQNTTIFVVADLTLNTKKMEVTRNGEYIQLTQQEFKLLHFLLMHQGQVISRKIILSKIWHYSEDIETRVIDVYIGYLRKKIDAPFNKKLIHSIRKCGYMIKE